MKATIIHGLPENRHDNKTSETEVHLKVWKLLFSSVAVFSSAVFQDVRHMLYTHRL